MIIRFSSVVPHPLSDHKFHDESIWNSNFELDSTLNSNILLNASSGKGKTTFSNILVGLRKDFSGCIEFDGKDINSISIHEWVEIRTKKISTVFQDLQLFPLLSAFENIQLKNEITHTFSEDQILNFLDNVGLIEQKDQKVSTLSMGQKQRVAIIRALCQPFEWLILDEPFSHLDIENSKICFDLIQSRCQKLKAGFILTALDPDESISFNSYLKL
jgi:ABC-type lipoprotein export system ATPase subunit